jgi:acetyl-CoA C-acetyltransferase
MIDPRTPVLIGAGQMTVRKGQMTGPRAMMKTVAELAAVDAGLGPAALAGVDHLAVVGFTVDAPGTAARLPVPRLNNPPAAAAEDLGAKPRRMVYTHMGGNTPQALVNWAAGEIAAGRADLVLLVGAEYLGSLMKGLGAGADLSHYGGGPEGKPERWGDDCDDCSPAEQAHGLSFPANTYPLFENALRAARGRSIAAHNGAMGRLFAPFSAVAAANPHAWFPIARSAEELVTVSPDNRMVGFPYPKYLNAIIQVDQAAAVLMASTAEADRLGVAGDKRVYLHGCADATEVWNPIDRENFHTSPAIRHGAKAAFAMAGKTPADIAVMDIYSCFPSAVEIGLAELGITEDDPRGFTITGGLPYFGGPGNNYVMHSIAEMMTRLRAKPGQFGLITANGWFLTKHAFGIYATTPTQGGWTRPDKSAPQAAIAAQNKPVVVAEPSGAATIETYTVIHARDKVRMGIVIGRDSDGRRFIANTPDDEATLLDLQSREGVGRPGTVVSGEGGMKNVFTPG